MDYGNGFHALRDGLYQIVGYPSDPSIATSTFMTSQDPTFVDLNALAHAQSAPNMLPNNVTSFPSTYMFHPSISNPYCNPYRDPNNFQTQVPPPHFISVPPAYDHINRQNLDTDNFHTYQYQMGGAPPLNTALPTAHIPDPFLAPSTAPVPNTASPTAQNTILNPLSPRNNNPHNPFNHIRTPPAPPHIPPPSQPRNNPYLQNAPHQTQFSNNQTNINFPYNNQPNLRYIYIPTNHNSSDLNIPNTTHIQELKLRADWVAWHQGTENVITTKGLLNHICDPPPPNVPWTALNAPSYPPVLAPGSTPAQVQEWQNWY